MNERLKDMVNNALLKLGRNAKTKLAAAAGLSPSTLVEILKRGHVPKAENVYSLAKACGRSDEEAQTMARECFPEAKDKAS